MSEGKLIESALQKLDEAKRFLSKLTDRNFLAFLFFLFLSASFWFFLTLYEDYEEEFAIPVQLQNVPEGTVITSDLPEAFHVILKDKGNTLMKYKYAGLPTINVDFTKYENVSGHAVVPVNELTRYVQHKVEPTTQVAAAKTERMEYFYNRNGLKMRIPVKLQSTIEAEQHYGISSVTVKPDSVLVHSIPGVFDTLETVYTEPLYLANVASKTEKKIKLHPVRGARLEPSEVTVSVTVDQMTEKTVQVPIVGVNFPATKVLRTFPPKVSIVFQVGMSMYRKISAEDFVLVLNYEDLLKETDGSAKLSLKSVPDGAAHVRIVPENVEFLIEDVINANN